MSSMRMLVLVALAALVGCERRHPAPQPQPRSQPRAVVETGARRGAAGTTTLTNADLPTSSSDAGAPRTDRLSVVHAPDLARNLGIVDADGGPIAPAPPPPAAPAAAPEPAPAGVPPPSAADTVPWSGSGPR